MAIKTWRDRLEFYDDHPADAMQAEITELRAALAGGEPVAWAMRRADGLVLDVITSEEHESYEGEYTMPLYTHPSRTLADAEISEIASRPPNNKGSVVHQFARDIEAALKGQA
jgi:hypothetical protein